ncbi:NAD(P)H-dependent oxidoreductase [Agrilactobacillus yilanensis]|uniref:NAD(P)H-dependent oxidoreductase n=1 Tax=Agrilactobacillus yilanensis TaxID=2485997 RepID=A0ABW4J6J2_9LACO|nr:NAD(P)H-dependent oxidoreductase [Agrilactobacillus yilanensis]
MKILGLSFGTKNGTNDSLCIEALMGAKETGADIEFIRMSTLNILHCTGCCTCSRMLTSGKGNMCILNDDFDWLLDKMLDADGIIISDPIFEEGASGLFHTLMDRFGPRLDRGNNIINDKIAEQIGGQKTDDRIFQDKVISYMGVGGSDWGTRVQCEHAMHALVDMWQIIDNKWFPWSKSIIMDDEHLAEVHQVGVNIANAAADISEATYQGEAGVCPHCHNKLFYLTPGTNEAVCAQCGIVGELKIENGVTNFVFADDQLDKAHDTLPGKFIHGNDIKDRIEGEFVKTMKTPEFKARKKAYSHFIKASKPEKSTATMTV